MLIRSLPLLAGIAPLVAIFGALWIGVASDALPSCFPLIDGCISISATGRKPPGSFLFRSVMATQPVLLVVVWYFSVLWLRSLDPELRRSTTVAILTSGIVGSVALITYVTFLGTKEPIYEFMRRFGIYFGFLGVGVAQIVVAVALRRICRSSRQRRFVKTARVMLGLCAAVLALGILNMFLKRVVDDADSSENRIEWIVFVVMQCYFFALYHAWQLTDFGVSVSTRDA
ncbi:MAG: hypothetical protein OES10_09175 [Gammaproteobacteria bacterium]|nr:hypothetical protein [Gammaproteobacteria bacterium]